MKKLISVFLIFFTSCAVQEKAFIVVGYEVKNGDSINVVRAIKPAEDYKPVMYKVGEVLRSRPVKIIK